MITRLLFTLICSFCVGLPAFGQLISGVAPNASTAGASVTLIISGTNTNFAAATGAYIRKAGHNGTFVPATNFAVNSATNMTANFSIPPNAPLGDYNIGVYTNTELPAALSVGVGPGSNYGYVSGYVNHDYNGNCAIDPGEPPLANRVVSIGGQAVATDANGFYSTWLLLGNYTATTTAHSGEFITPCGFPSPNLTVALDSVNNSNIYLDTLTTPSLSLWVLNSRMRPGFQGWFSAIIRNTGFGPSTPTTGYVVVPSSSLFSATYSPITSTNLDTVFFNVPAIPAGGNFGIGGNGTVTGMLGQIMSFRVFVDEVPGEWVGNNFGTNTAGVSQDITGSYDPNDKQVWNENGDNADGFIDPSDSLLRYLIRFQNTGTDTAFNIYVRDTFSTDLDISTLQVVDASHPYTMTINGVGNVQWTFANILLVDSTTNEPLSHGYIDYIIKRKPGLPVGTQIDNTAHIYFDFNAPIVTNTVSSVICPEITAGYTQVTTGQTIAFTDTSLGAITTYLWDFGDGNTSSQASPSHTYAAAGNYNVCLYTSNSCGRLDSSCQVLPIGCAPPAAAYSFTANNLTLSFTDLSTNAPTSWLWDFGDGNTSPGQNPTHTYAMAGTYTVCLVANNTCGPDSTCMTINVSCTAPVAGFGASVNGFVATFTDMSTGAPTQWLWDFGDGNTSTQQSPTHTYANAGTYTVCLIANNICGTDSSCQSVTITCTPPVAGFGASVSGFTATFTDMSTGAPTQWLWDFGDGNTSTAQNPTHTYANAGTYTVCLIANNICGTDSSCQSVTAVCVGPVASFVFTPNQLNVVFSDQSTNSPTSWAWDFGDGNTSTAQNPNHSYAAPGTYTACLVVTNGCGADSICSTVTVVCSTPSAVFSPLVNQLAVNFVNTSSNASTYGWDFGDGNTSTMMSPNHTYAAPGTYTVCLIATGPCGADTTCQSVTVTCNVPVASFSNSVSQTTVNFTDLSTGAPTSWAWDFGDGGTSTMQNPSHLYASQGTYTVCLIVTGGCGSDTVCNTVTVICPGPNAAFAASPTQLQVNFSDFSTNTTSWAWDFGDGNNSTLQNPVHNYAASGTYTVCLISTNACGSDTSCQSVTVNCALPAASFLFAGNALVFNFTNQSTNGTSYAWDFGDGAFSSGVNPSHTYAMPGVYTVCLVVTNGCGSDSMCTTVNVNCLTPQAAFSFGGNITALNFTDQSLNSPTSWTWDFGDGNTSTMQNPTHTYAFVGTYNVCLTASSVCGTTTTCQFVNVSVGIGDEFFTRFDLYPNPTADQVTLDLELAKVVHLDLRLYNGLGVLIDEHHPGKVGGSMRQSFDLAGMPAGLYLLEVQVNGETFTRKVTKQ